MSAYNVKIPLLPKDALSRSSNYIKFNKQYENYSGIYNWSFIKLTTYLQ
jgi:hypothetical protein